MKKYLLFLFLLLLLSPAAASARAVKHAGFTQDKGTEINVNEPLGWPVSVSASTNVRGSIQSLPGMVVVRLQAYTPWYKFFSKVPPSTTLTISGLPKEKLLHIYTDGYRTHTTATTTSAGILTLERPTGRGMQVIIKEKPSTKHIYIGGTLRPAGGDCSTIGIWNATTKTCTLTSNVNQDITIEDDRITLDGNGHTVTGAGSADGVYTDVSFVTIKNLNVSNFARGVVYADAFLTHAAGGDISNITSSNNVIGFADDGVPSITLSNSTFTGGVTGFSLIDQVDGFPTDNISITGSTFSGISTAVFADGVSATLTRNNFIGNTTDITNSGSTLTLTVGTGTRGNFWSKNTSCVQDTANPSHCTNPYDTGPFTDTLPWACENGWTHTCPVAPPPPSGSGTLGEVTGSGNTANVYSSASVSSSVVKVVPKAWVLDITDSSNSTFYRVSDPTDNSVGYIEKSRLDTNSSRQNEFDARIINEDTISKRKSIITEATETYFAGNADNSLYGAIGGLDGLDAFQNFITDGDFPKELFLAMAVQESGAHNYDNTICNLKADGSRDGGIGIFQITSKSLKGLGSGLNNTAHKNDCDSSTGWVGSNSNYFSNLKQGIYANIKDAMRVLQIKYNRFKNDINNYSPTKASWFSLGTTSVDNRDMKVVLSVRGYNGFGGGCFVLNNSTYLKPVGQKLASIGSYFPGYSYTESRDLDQKLILAEENKTAISICSPGSLQIVDSTGRITGYISTSILNEIPNIVYDDETLKNADIIFPQEDYRVRVIGTESGTYTLYQIRYIAGTPVEFKATDIPIKTGEVHEYLVIWDTANKKVISSTLKIDTNGDGKFDKTIKGGATLIYTTGAGSAKVEICHKVPKNNPHTITIAQPALKAHLAHGDTIGSCPNK